MAGINLQEIRVLREESAKKLAEIREKILEMESQMRALEERVKVYDELLGGVLPLSNGGLGKPQKKIRTQRSTKAEMARRKQIIEELLLREGDMQPRELLPLVVDSLGYEMEAHHLRAVLRRHPETFQPCPERHGFWGVSTKDVGGD